MLSKKIISFGNAIEPKEKQIIAFGGNFLGNRTVKVIASGVIAAIFIVLGTNYVVHDLGYNYMPKAWYYILGAFIFFIMFIGIGEFFANIRKFMFKKYVIADIAALVLFVPPVTVMDIFCAVDLALIYDYGQFPSMFLRGIAFNLLWFGIPSVFSIVFGRLALHGKKVEQ
ncbi:MAG: hypothetical protein OSJ43_07435 [Oscillospiraceae bacterium]|nr:hypothetical protein [Oscillospiraceae bacterium]